jgi:hypothetical protein
MKRRKVSSSKSRSSFTKGAMNINAKNIRPRLMRGGMRL